MKNNSLIISIVSAVIAVAALVLNFTNGASPKKSAASAEAETAGVSAVAGDIVYIQMDSLIVNYDMFNDLMTAFQNKVQGLQDDLQKKCRKLESDAKAFENQYTKGLLTRSAAEDQQNKLVQRQQVLQEESARLQGELQEEEMVINNQVLDAIKTYLQTYNEEHQFALILTTTSATNNIINVNPALDVTADVLNGLNEEYIKVRNTVVK